MKAAWLDAIAAMTGGTSNASQYIERASQKLEMMTKFDQEERIYKIWRDVYYAQDGNYDAPASKKEAAERARRLGASPEETKKIYGWAEEQADLVEWWRTATNEQGYETTTTHGKKERPPQGAGARWNMGSPPDRLVAPTTTAGKTVWAVPPGESVARLVPATTAMQPGWTKEQSGGLFQDYARDSQQLIRSDDPDAWSKGVAMWESYFAGSQKDPITQRISMMQPDQLRKAAEDQMRRMYAAVGKTPPGATASVATTGPITDEQKAANANASRDQVIARRKQLQAENQGKSTDEIVIMLINEGYNLE